MRWHGELTVFVCALGASCVSTRAPGPDEEPRPPTTDASASAVAPPTADALFERALEAIGGRERVFALRGFRAEGRLERPGVSARLRVLARAPDFVRTTVTLKSGEVFEEGHNGTVAWVSDPYSGFRVVRDAAARETIRRADLHRAVRFREHFPKRRTVGKADFQGRQAWQVEVETSTGRIEQRFFDARTGRAVGFQSQIQQGDRVLRPVVVYEEWMEVDGLMLPSRIVQSASPGAQVITYDTIVLEAPPMKAFDPPRS